MTDFNVLFWSYFEWKTGKDGKKQPYFIYFPQNFSEDSMESGDELRQKLTETSSFTKVSEAKITAEEVKNDEPKMKREVPEMKHEEPEMKHEEPEMKHEVPEMKREEPEMKQEGTEMKQETKIQNEPDSKSVNQESSATSRDSKTLVKSGQFHYYMFIFLGSVYMH